MKKAPMMQAVTVRGGTVCVPAWLTRCPGVVVTRSHWYVWADPLTEAPHTAYYKLTHQATGLALSDRLYTSVKVARLTAACLLGAGIDFTLLSPLDNAAKRTKAEKRVSLKVLAEDGSEKKIDKFFELEPGL